jgi:glutaminyl-tRNA synthetase
VPFAREVWIERDDFMEVPPKGFHRLVPGGEVRLRGVGIVRCDEVIKDGDQVLELRCSLDLDSRPGLPGSERKIKGTVHWISARHGVPAEIRLYDRLFTVANPDSDEGGKTYSDYLNPDSIRTVQGFIEPEAANLPAETGIQFERLGFFCTDRFDHRSDKPVFNRTVTLRDTWAKQGG